MRNWTDENSSEWIPTSVEYWNSKGQKVLKHNNRNQFEQELRNKTIDEFASRMISMMPGHAQDILHMAENLKRDLIIIEREF